MATNSQCNESPTACHVVVLSRSRKRDDQQSKPTSFRFYAPRYVQTPKCDTLPEALVQEIGENIAHDERAAFVTTNEARSGRATIWMLVDRFGLPGIALVRQSPPRELQIPQPAQLPFNPIPLTGGHPGLIAFLSDRENAAQALWHSRFERLLTDHLMPVLIVVGCLGLSLLSLYNFVESRSRGPAIGLVFYPVALAAILYLLSRTGRWFLVPGGIIVRKYPGWGFHLALERFTPQDSLLELTRVPNTGPWQASLTPRNSDKKRSTRTCLSTLEAHALLAAWQSRLEPPPVEQCGDLL